MRRLSRALPAGLKRLAPVVRERDALRVRAEALQAEIDRMRAAPPAGRGVHGTYVGDGRVLVAPTWGGRLLVPSDDIGLMPELVAHGIYDVPFTAWTQRTIQPGAVVVDVGANVGLFSVLLGYQVWESGRVIAYEPVPRLLDLLRDNVAMNWLADRVEIVPKAASAASGRRSFLAPRRFAMGGSLQPVEATLDADVRSSTVDRIEVETEPLDALAGRFERIDLVKIDVEGAEEQVLAGMEQLLSTGTVRHVTFEVARPLLGADWGPFLARLRRLERDGWCFATIGTAGETTPLAISEIEARGRYSQVLMSPAA